MQLDPPPPPKKKGNPQGNSFIHSLIIFSSHFILIRVEVAHGGQGGRIHARWDASPVQGTWGKAKKNFSSEEKEF